MNSISKTGWKSSNKNPKNKIIEGSHRKKGGHKDRPSIPIMKRIELLNKMDSKGYIWLD